MQKHLELPNAFADLGVEVRFLKALTQIGFVQPSEIQQHLIPPALAGKDVLGQARTGTGKTAAFGLPILQKIDPAGRLQAICLTPTRELAVQVAGELIRLAKFAQLHIAAIYGGQRIATQLHQLGRKPHFVVGTPGRVIDFMNRGVLSIENVRFAVLDEVDRMLDIGFRDDIRNILGRIRAPHQTIFVSATIDEEIKRLAKRYMNDPIEVNVSEDRLTVDEVDQSYVTAEPWDKFRLLRMILEQEKPPICIVFCNTKAAAHKLAKRLHEAGVEAKEIHGDLIQRKRDRVMASFRRHQIRVLVATDLASRGIDVSAISHIINYDVPQDSEVYVHRIGRTARMGERGVAITFVTREQGKELTQIEMLINREIPPREVPGFKPSFREDAPARVDRRAAQTVEASASRTAASPDRSSAPPQESAGHSASTGSTAPAVAPPPPKRLGDKFRRSRSRRRR